MSNQNRKACVIGAGLAGMAVALRLAARGWQVSVFENHRTLGGKMNRWESEGFCFDTGPSLITMPWVFEELFSAVREEMSDHLRLHLVNPLAHYHFADGKRLEMDASLVNWMDTLREIEPHGDIRFLKLMRLGARLFELSKHTFFRRGTSEPPDRETLTALRHLPLRHAWGSYRKTVHHFFTNPYLRYVYNRFPTYVGSSPLWVPATLTLIPYLEHAFGGWYIKGGLYTLILRLRDLGQRLGVRWMTDQQVVRVHTRTNRVECVEVADGSVHSCAVVVHNGDASALPRLLGEKDPATLREKDRSLSGVVMLVGLRKRLEAQHHTVCFSADYDHEFEELFSRRRFPEDPTVYVSIPSRDDRSLAPPGGETLFIMANAPANDGDAWDKTMIAGARERIFNRLRKSGFPEFEKDIVVEECITPRTMAERYLMPGGAIYGTNSHGWQKAFFRPPNKHPRIGGLYCVGGSSHPGGGTPTVLLSARIASELIARNEV